MAGYYQQPSPHMQPHIQHVQQPGYFASSPPPMMQQQQQQQQQQTIVIASQPQSQPTQQLAVVQNSREWHQGVCACFNDLGQCCCAFWCPPCYWCQLSSRMNEYYCGPHYCPCGCFELFRVAMRTKLRTMYGIRGSICEDAACVVCCPFCSAVQIGQELKHRGID